LKRLLTDVKLAPGVTEEPPENCGKSPD